MAERESLRGKHLKGRPKGVKNKATLFKEVMKICKKCGTEKPTTDYYKAKGNVDGLHGSCKACYSAKERERYASRREEVLQQKKEYAKKNDEKIKTRRRQRYEENREMVLERNREWRKANKGYITAQSSKRYAAKMNAVPSWSSEEELFLIREAYALSRERAECTGFEWHVDHIIPLQGKDVCGLHTIDNLQVIPAVANLKKGVQYASDY